MDEIITLGVIHYIFVQVTIYCRLQIGRDGYIDQSEVYDISQLVLGYRSCMVRQTEIEISS